MQDAERTRDPGSSFDQVYSDDELEFLRAVDAYKRKYKRPWPSWGEILTVFKSLGYRRVAEPTPLPEFVRGSSGRPPTHGKVLPKDHKDKGGAQP